MKILVLGASGMIGSKIFQVLSRGGGTLVYGSIRSDKDRCFFDPSLNDSLVANIDAIGSHTLLKLFNKLKPDVVVNCIGLTKHQVNSNDPKIAIPLNALLPHRLVYLCGLVNARLIHISTDCVFSGEKGNYAEQDNADAIDLYGKSKALGELTNFPNAVTLRTSTIGPELRTKYGLLEWFLSQRKSCQGFSRAIFSGLPSVVLAEIIRDVIIPRKDLSGLYHIAAKPINKFELLGLIAKVYEKEIQIIEDDTFKIDRSLNADRFKIATGYKAPEWPELIELMHAYK
ncbi:SDR family oxidoreductase [Polynucleobacter paneuropaeus]|nr:SDR family oxidoreductase [Polynucleobacter paneuropaeus]MBT8610776.1 SDR family oxidoreductase [Polynucleobacter paneuropaeus]